MPVEIDRPNRSASSGRTGRLPNRYTPESNPTIADNRGPKAPAGVAGGGTPVVRLPQRRQVNVCWRYSVTWGRIGGISATWRRSDSASIPASGAAQVAQWDGRHSTT